MSPHDWFVEHRLDFVTRTLEAEEERSFVDHLGRCDECGVAIRELERELAWLPMGTRPVRPRPGFRRQVVRSVLGEGRPGWRRWVTPLTAAASLTVAVGVVAGGYLPERREANRLSLQLSERSVELAALRDSISIMRQATRVLQAAISMQGHQGGLLIFADDKSHRWNVVMHGLPPAPPGEAYQFWFICADGMVRGGTLTPDPVRPAFMTLEMPTGGGVVMGASLTMESSSNVSPAPRGKELAHLML